ncbi:MAG: hypothetical protein J0H71_05435 [Rhizobiales bacterium]|nr:hypothetical protein [Hyphomicrobiales bacterium]
MTRVRPQQRRALETIAIEHDGHRFKIGVGREFADRRELGAPVEVFINAQKVNSLLDALACDGAILMSLLLQHGCTAADIARSMKRNSDGAPASVLGLAASLLNQTAHPEGD